MVHRKVAQRVMVGQQIDMMVPISGSSIDSVRGRDGLHGVAVVAGLIVAKVITVDEIEHRPFSTDKGKVGMRARLIRKQHGTAGSEVMIFGFQFVGVRWREVIGDLKTTAIESQFQKSVAIVLASLGEVELSISSGDEDVAGRICRRPGIACPETTIVRIGRGDEDSFLLQCLRIVGEYPSMIRTDIAGGAQVR